MSIGLGFFLGLVFCGVIFLYTQTKDRWNWGKCGKILLYLTGTSFAILLLLIGIIYFYEEYQEHPKVITELKGIQLGENFQDAIFKHGKAKMDVTRDVEFLAKYIEERKDKKGTPEFERVAEAYKNAKDAEAKALAKGATDGGYWLNDVYVFIKNNKIDVIAHKCNDGYDGTELNGIGCASKGDEIINKFGSAVRVQCSTDKDINTSRVYDVVNYGTRYYLEKNTVNRMSIFSPATLESNIGENWGKCG